MSIKDRIKPNPTTTYITTDGIEHASEVSAAAHQAMLDHGKAIKRFVGNINCSDRYRNGIERYIREWEAAKAIEEVVGEQDAEAA